MVYNEFRLVENVTGNDCVEKKSFSLYLLSLQVLNWVDITVRDTKYRQQALA